MRGVPARRAAAALGVSERTVHRYWKATAMVSENFVPDVPGVPPAELHPRDYEVIAHHIAGWAPDVATALELAGALEVPRQAFCDALSLIRSARYAAPAGELFTHLHMVSRGVLGQGLRVTECGRVMFGEQLWQLVERDDGDPVCPACLAKGNGHEQAAMF